MRLYELIKPSRSTSGPIDHVASDDAKKGAYGSVEDDKSDEHMVNKRYHRTYNTLDNDGYYTYINTLDKQDLPDTNPFFPRVYNINIEQDAAGKIKPTFNIEKLSSLKTLDTDVIYAIGDSLFNNIDDYVMDSRRKILGDNRMTSGMLGLAIRDVLTRRDYGLLKNHHLADALKVIDNIISSNKKFFNDVYDENIMFRGTPHGPQVVLSDPIGDRLGPQLGHID